MNFWAVMLFFDMLIPLAMIIFGRLFKSRLKKKLFSATGQVNVKRRNLVLCQLLLRQAVYIYGWVMMPVSVIILLPYRQH